MSRMLASAAITLLLGSAGVANELPSTPDPKVAAEQRAPFKRALLGAAHASAAFADTAYTQAHIYAPGAYERDPFARPIVRHAGLAYGVAAGEMAGLWWLSGRMERSERWHRVWWVPQAVAIGLHAGALAQSIHSWRR